jgi:hypothetical protein
MHTLKIHESLRLHVSIVIGPFRQLSIDLKMN